MGQNLAKEVHLRSHKHLVAFCQVLLVFPQETEVQDGAAVELRRADKLIEKIEDEKEKFHQKKRCVYPNIIGKGRADSAFACRSY